jgi:hypothetical protein
MASSLSHLTTLSISHIDITNYVELEGTILNSSQMAYSSQQISWKSAQPSSIYYNKIN